MPSKDNDERVIKTILKARGKFGADMIRWVTSPEREITQDVDRILDRVVKDRRRRMEVFLTGLAKKYVERAVYFIGEMPKVEEELLDPDRIRTMKNADLIRLLALLADQVTDAADFLRSFVSDEDLQSEPLPSPAAEFTSKEIDASPVSDEERKAAEELSSESRQRLGGVLKRVLQAMEADGKGNFVVTLPAPESDDDADTEDEPKTKLKPKKSKKSRGANK